VRRRNIVHRKLSPGSDGGKHAMEASEMENTQTAIRIASFNIQKVFGKSKS